MIFTKSPGASTPYKVKVIGCSSLKGGGGELGTIKTLTYDSNYFAQNLN